MNRIGDCLCIIYRQLWGSTFNDGTKNLASVLFTLIVPEHGNLDSLFMTKPDVVMHLARQECISFSTNGSIQHEIPGSATNGNTLDGTVEQLIVLQSLNVEGLFHPLKKRQRIFGFWQIAYHATACLNLETTGQKHRTRFKKLNINKPQFLCHAIIDTILRIVQIRVSSIDAKFILNRKSQTSLHQRLICHLLQAVKKQRVMAHDKVTAKIDGLMQDILGHV